MRYLLLAYEDEQRVNAMPIGERKAFDSTCLAYDEVLRQNGHLIAVEDLQSSSTTTTLRVHNGKVSLSDGPYAQTKEQLTRLFIINARDLNEAIRLASNMPQARAGPIDVRPLAQVDALYKSSSSRPSATQASW